MARKKAEPKKQQTAVKEAAPLTEKETTPEKKNISVEEKTAPVVEKTTAQ